MKPVSHCGSARPSAQRQDGGETIGTATTPTVHDDQPFFHSADYPTSYPLPISWSMYSVIVVLSVDGITSMAVVFWVFPPAGSAVQI